MGRFAGTRKREEQDKNYTGDENKVEGVVQKLLVFFKKNLDKIANLDQKICQKKAMIRKLRKNFRTSSL